jgi:hypothetical protein
MDEPRHIANTNANANAYYTTDSSHLFVCANAPVVREMAQSAKDMSNCKCDYCNKNHAYKRILRELASFAWGVNRSKIYNSQCDNRKTNLVLDDYCFEFNDMYPFYPPKVFSITTERQVIGKLRPIPTKRIHRILKSLGVKCFCCHSITNIENWSPIYGIAKIMEELKDHKNTKQSVKYIIAAEELCDRFNLRIYPNMIFDYIVAHKRG